MDWWEGVSFIAIFIKFQSVNFFADFCSQFHFQFYVTLT